MLTWIFKLELLLYSFRLITSIQFLAMPCSNPTLIFTFFKKVKEGCEKIFILNYTFL